MDHKEKLASAKAEHKRMKRLRARFNGHKVHDEQVSPGYTQGDGKDRAAEFRKFIESW